MKTWKPQPLRMDRRGLLRGLGTLGAGLVGAAALGSVLPGLAQAQATLAQATQAAQLTDADREDIKRVESYLNGITTMQASFQQFTQGEGLAFGRIYLRRPGRLRVEYDPPSEILLVADGTLLSYYDAELNHIEQVPLRLSPLWFLLRNDVRLGGGDVTVTSFRKAANAILIGMVQSKEPEAGSVLLELGDKPLELRQWSIIDSAGTEVRVGLYNTEFGIPLSAALFATPRKKRQDR